MSEPTAEYSPASSHPLLRVVLDTNVYVSGLILARGTPFQILEAWRQQAYILVTSELIIVEIERVLRYPRIRDRYGVTEADSARLIASLRADALIVAGINDIEPACSDPDDDKFLACALEAGADCIVTGDPDLLTLVSYAGIDILKPSEFLARLNTPQDTQ
ncbi:MAG: putative toxin-antitoxin system toxin component, PIN family [Anaerolineae bacterium]|nr:putative toxin-antitoxin system toxin component, PIN family [Anaerolineae bacterium]